MSILKNIIIYTDGSAKFNGKLNSSGGIGVFFGIDDKRNISNETVDTLKYLIPDYKFTEKFKITNNISELLAIYKALTIIKPLLDKKRIIYIKSDSMYSINSLTKWYKKWEYNDWKTANNKPVLNKEIIHPIIENYMKKYPDQIFFVKIKAHTKEPNKSDPRYTDWFGNFMSDFLATQNNNS